MDAVDQGGFPLDAAGHVPGLDILSLSALSGKGDGKGAVLHPAVSDAPGHAAQVEEVGLYVFHPGAGAAILNEAALLHHARHASGEQAQGLPAAVHGKRCGAVPHHAPGDFPHDAAQGGVEVPGQVLDGPGGGNILDRAADRAEQTVVPRPFLLDGQALDGVAAAVKEAGKFRLPQADGDPSEPGHIQVRRQAHGQVRPAGQVAVVDRVGEDRQILRQTDLQVCPLTGADLQNGKQKTTTNKDNI